MLEAVRRPRVHVRGRAVPPPHSCVPRDAHALHLGLELEDAVLLDRVDLDDRAGAAREDRVVVQHLDRLAAGERERVVAPDAAQADPVGAGSSPRSGAPRSAKTDEPLSRDHLKVGPVPFGAVDLDAVEPVLEAAVAAAGRDHARLGRRPDEGGAAAVSRAPLGAGGKLGDVAAARWP